MLCSSRTGALPQMPGADELQITSVVRLNTRYHVLPEVMLIDVSEQRVAGIIIAAYHAPSYRLRRHLRSACMHRGHGLACWHVTAPVVRSMPPTNAVT